MRLERLRIGGFGTFNRGLDVDFGADRLNIVIGRNEAGKSTMMSAVFGVIFGFKDAALQKKFEPWEQHDAYAGEVQLQTQDGRQIVVKRDFRDNTAEIGEIVGGEYRAHFLGSANPRGHTDEDIEYYKRLEAIVGFQDEAVFRATVFMGQSALRTDITDQIRRLVSGSNSTDFKGVLHDLHYRFSELTMENPWRKKAKSAPRKIEKVRDEVTTDTRKLGIAREVFLKSVALDQDVKRLDKELRDLKADIEDTRTTLGFFERFCKLVKDREDARARFVEANKRRATFTGLKDKVQEIDAELAKLKRFAKVGDDFPELATQLRGEMRELEQQESKFDFEKENLAALRPVPNTKLGAAMAAVGLAIGAALVAQGFVVPGAAVALVLGAGLFFLGRTLATGYKQRLAELEASVASQEQGIRARTKTIETLIARSQGLLGKGDPAELVAAFRRSRTLGEERHRRLSAMTVLGEWTEIDATYQRTAEENLRCNGLMEIILRDAPYLSQIADDAVAISKSMEELKRRIVELTASIDAGEGALTDARIAQARLSNEAEYDLPALEENVDAKRRELETLELERDSLRLVIDCLEECVNEFQEGDLTKLSDEVSGIFRTITSNRYTRVTLSANMEPMLTKFDNTHIAPGDLSQGTQDQLYFAMRLAIARHLSRKVPLPFFLDDPFVNFDAERLEVTRKLLSDIDEHQVVMVTCDREYERWPAHLIDLDRARSEALTTASGRVIAAFAPAPSAAAVHAHTLEIEPALETTSADVTAANGQAPAESNGHAAVSAAAGGEGEREIEAPAG
jgi:uncharacterized protein YhaN